MIPERRPPLIQYNIQDRSQEHHANGGTSYATAKIRMKPDTLDDNREEDPTTCRFTLRDIPTQPEKDDPYNSRVSRFWEESENGLPPYLGQRIALVGLGTVGSNLATVLAGYSFGIVGYDPDTVESHNLQAGEFKAEDVGMLKAAVVAKNVMDSNPSVAYQHTFSDEAVNENNIRRIVNETTTAVILACDDVTTQLLVHQEARRLRKPVLMATDSGHGSVNIKVADYSKLPPDAPLLFLQNHRIENLVVGMIEEIKKLRESSEDNTERLRLLNSRVITLIVGAQNSDLEMLDLVTKGALSDGKGFPQAQIAARMTVHVLPFLLKLSEGGRMPERVDETHRAFEATHTKGQRLMRWAMLQVVGRTFNRFTILAATFDNLQSKKKTR